MVWDRQHEMPTTLVGKLQSESCCYVLQASSQVAIECHIESGGHNIECLIGEPLAVSSS